MTGSHITLEQFRPDAAGTIAHHFDDFIRAVCTDESSLVSDTCVRYITGEPHPFGNLAIVRGSAGAGSVAEAVRPLMAGGFPSAVCLMDPGSAGQREAVLGQGFVHAESMPLMAVSDTTLAATALPSGYRVRECGTGDAEDWIHAMCDGYGIPRSLGPLFGIERTRERCPEGSVRYFAVEHEGRLVATSLVRLHEGVAGIYCVATLPEHRGKGLGAHLTAEPLRVAWGLGYRTGLLQASAMGAPVYRRIGFEAFGEMELYVWMPG